jgi:hypothetical protein
MGLFAIRCSQCGHQGRVTAAQLERVLTCVGCNRSERPTGWLALPARKPPPPKPAQPPRGKRQLQRHQRPSAAVGAPSAER